MHMCENNCALTLEDEIKFWGLDDALLRVAAVFCHIMGSLFVCQCLSVCPLFEIKFFCYGKCSATGNGNLRHTLCLLCLSV